MCRGSLGNLVLFNFLLWRGLPYLAHQASSGHSGRLTPDCESFSDKSLECRVALCPWHTEQSSCKQHVPEKRDRRFHFKFKLRSLDIHHSTPCPVRFNNIFASAYAAILTLALSAFVGVPFQLVDAPPPQDLAWVCVGPQVLHWVTLFQMS